MSKGEMVRALFQQRLTAAAEEIFGLFERTIAEYEEELCRSKEENEKQQKLLDAVWKPEVRLHKVDIQQLLVIKEEVPHEQQEWCPSQDQEDPPKPEPPLIKEEQEELWSSPEEADITKVPFSPVLVESGDDGASPQSAKLQQRHTEQMETGADGEDCGGPQPARNSRPDKQPQTEDCPVNKDSHKVTDLHFQSLLKHDEVSISGVKCKNDKIPLSCSLSGERCKQKNTLKEHRVIYKGEKRFGCSVCSKRFKSRQHLTLHMVVHTGERNFICSVCGKTFNRNSHVKQHMILHTGEKPFSCTVCKKTFRWHYEVHRHTCVGPPQSAQLQQRHTEQMETGAGGEDCGGPQPARNSHPDQHETEGEKRFCCSVCSKTFKTKQHLSLHMVMHTGERNFICSVCGKAFKRKSHLTEHMIRHTGKQHSCSGCKKTFLRYCELNRHRCADSLSAQLPQRHTEQRETGVDLGEPQPAGNSHPDQHETEGEKRLCCSVCSKTFKTKNQLSQHMFMHTGERNFICSVCGKKFKWKSNLTEHMARHTGKQHNCSGCKKTFFRRCELNRHKCADSLSAQLRQRHTEQRGTGVDLGEPQPAGNSRPDTHVQPETEDCPANKDSREITKLDSEEKTEGPSETEDSDDY